MRGQRREIFVIVALAVSTAVILWITIFSRIGNDSRYCYPLFSSYRAIINGSKKALLENVENIILFCPIGVVAVFFFRTQTWQAIVPALIISLLIECCQWFFWLGTFEWDDIIHNAIGAGIGAVLTNRIGNGVWLQGQTYKRVKSFSCFLLLTITIISTILLCQSIQFSEMRRLAALNDRLDGTKNLLVLSPNPVYIGNPEFNITYNSDGSIKISGKSDNRAWIDMGHVKLQPGQYFFSGLSDEEDKTVALVLDAFNPTEGKYAKITQEIGFSKETTFELTDETKIRLLISIYPGYSFRLVARPVIFQKSNY